MQIIRDEEIEKKVAQHKEQKNFNLTHLIGIVQWQKKLSISILLPIMTTIKMCDVNWHRLI